MERWVNYLVLGAVSSEAEFKLVVANIRASVGNRRCVRELVEFLNMVTKSEELGAHTEAKRWKAATDDSGVKLYFGKLKPGQSGIWAAVAVAADQRSLTLLKIVDTFGGGDNEHEGLLADALHRKAKGTIVQGQIV